MSTALWLLAGAILIVLMYMVGFSCGYKERSSEVGYSGEEG